MAVNTTTTVTNGDVKVDVNAETDGTKTTTTEVDGIVNVGTVADAVVQAATTTTVEQPETVVEQPAAVVDVPVVAPTSSPLTDTDGDPVTDPVTDPVILSLILWGRPILGILLELRVLVAVLALLFPRIISPSRRVSITSTFRSPE